mmetsp:Transcript_32194/g.63736  ORF Transcript_32194/g.63736 Transcript_32194/m.63736 type:complete len:93 (-) Transcript_32194:1762-2040(-)
MSRINATERKKTKRANSVNAYNQKWSGLISLLAKTLSQFVGMVLPIGDSYPQSLNSNPTNSRTAYVNEQRYCAHRSHFGIREVATKKPAKSI